MPLFTCPKCNCIENTALCNYWSLRREGKEPICSECDPNIGEWHGKFPKEFATDDFYDDVIKRVIETEET